MAAARGARGPGEAGRPPGRQRRRQQQGRQQRKPPPAPRGEGKKKVNCEPRNQDEQEIPFRLREIMRSRREMKGPVSGKKRKAAAQLASRKTWAEAQGAEPDIPVPKFKQRKWESERAYVRRMEQEARHVLFLTRNQAERRPEAPERREKSERKKAFQRRRLDRVRRRKAEKAAERLEEELLRDTVKFGEVALQPPELTARPRGSAGRKQPLQPGGRSLTLRRMLSPGGAPRPPPASLARLRMVGEERARVVAAYRALKQQRQTAPTLPPGKRPRTPA